MTTLPDRTRTALLLVDVQRGVVAEAHRRDEVLTNVAVVAERARSQGVPVVWVQHADPGMPIGSDAWQLVPEVPRRESERVVRKRFGDAFEDTELEDVLAEAGVGRLVVAGAQTDACVRATIHGAFARGYDVTLVSDAHTTEDLSAWGAPPPAQVIAHTNLYWAEQAAPGRTAGVVPARDVPFS
jgi:nicotinamidase-related amidase